jgi:hypothetical protein
MKTMKEFWKEMRTRWHNAMPRFFKRMMWICGLISGTALAAHESMSLAGIQPHAWWLDIEPYLVAVPAGAMFACKFTQQYSGKPIEDKTDEDGTADGQPKPGRRHREPRRTVLDKDIDTIDE